MARILPCEGAVFESLYIVAGFDTGEYDHAVVSSHPDTHGHIYHLHYRLGDPILTFADAHFIAPNFTRWLAMHVESWDIYQRDWREGMNHFRHLIEHERTLQQHEAA